MESKTRKSNPSISTGNLPYWQGGFLRAGSILRRTPWRFVSRINHLEKLKDIFSKRSYLDLPGVDFVSWTCSCRVDNVRMAEGKYDWVLGEQQGYGRVPWADGELRLSRLSRAAMLTSCVRCGIEKMSSEITREEYPRDERKTLDVHYHALRIWELSLNPPRRLYPPLPIRSAPVEIWTTMARTIAHG